MPAVAPGVVPWRRGALPVSLAGGGAALLPALLPSPPDALPRADVELASAMGTRTGRGTCDRQRGIKGSTAPQWVLTQATPQKSTQTGTASYVAEHCTRELPILRIGSTRELEVRRRTTQHACHVCTQATPHNSRSSDMGTVYFLMIA